MAVLPHHRRSPCAQIEVILYGATFRRSVTRAVIDEKKISIGQNVSVMLDPEPVQWIADDGELIVAAAEPPDHMTCPPVDLGDLSEAGERDDVIAVAVPDQRIRMIEVDGLHLRQTPAERKSSRRS